MKQSVHQQEADKEAVHQGEGVRRLREFRGLKQSALARLLGAAWTQQRVSRIEAKPQLTTAEREAVAGALHLPVGVIENGCGEAVWQFLSCTGGRPEGLQDLLTAAEKLKALTEENKALYALLLRVGQAGGAGRRQGFSNPAAAHGRRYQPAPAGGCCRGGGR
jgi:transcriptional regulator with XRE-family HTH domain